MDRETVKKLIIDKIMSEGSTIVGFADITGHEPDGYKNLSYAISFAMPMNKQVMRKISSGPSEEYYHLYRTVNRRIDDTSYEVTRILDDANVPSLMVAASQSINPVKGEKSYKGLISHRLVARLAGVGFVGKNGSIITEKWGPYVRLVTILIGESLGKAIPFKTACGECNACVRACPAKALSGITFEENNERDARVDVVRCSQHMKDSYMSIGRGSVCGICLSVCPFGRSER